MYMQESEEKVLICLKPLKRDHLVFFGYEIHQLFKQFDPSELYTSVKERVLVVA